MINLKEIPQKSGTYKFISNNEVVYVGSTKNLHHRMVQHNYNIKFSERPLYQFLAENDFEVMFELTDDYLDREQFLIEELKPRFNIYRAKTNINVIHNGSNYRKEYYKKYRDEESAHNRAYDNQQCCYEGEYLTLNALRLRFRRLGKKNSVREAKIYLVEK